MTLAERYLLARPPLGTYTLVTTDTATGASPNTVDTTGIADGDLCVWAMTTTNSAPNVAGPEGGGWTQLWREDSSGNEIGTCWFKIAGGAEPGTWDWTHSAGTLVTSAMMALRTPHTTLVDSSGRRLEGFIPGFGAPPRRGLWLGGVHISNSALAVVLEPVPILTTNQNSQLVHLAVEQLASLSTAPLGAVEVLSAQGTLRVVGGAIFR